MPQISMYQAALDRSSPGLQGSEEPRYHPCKEGLDETQHLFIRSLCDLLEIEKSLGGRREILLPAVRPAMIDRYLSLAS